MSAYIVRDEVIDKIIVSIQQLNSFSCFIGKQKKRISDYPKSERAIILQNIADDLLRMNTQAVNFRYNERTKIRKPIKNNFNISELDSFRPYPIADLVENYKAIICFLYQCSEGKYPNSKLFRQVDRFAGDYAAMIVHRLPEYSTASWG